jgi:signal transduction histidine kinase
MLVRSSLLAFSVLGVPNAANSEGLSGTDPRQLPGTGPGSQYQARWAVPRRLPSAVTTAVYRMVQEALTNVTRHAAATRVCVRLHTDNTILQCSVEDDGTGFDVGATVLSPRRGLGLLGMRERIAAVGGSLHIASSLGAGTQLFATIPLEIQDGDQTGACRRS